MSKKSDLTPEEMAILQQAMAGVKPIVPTQHKITLAKDRPKLKSKPSYHDNESYEFIESFDLTLVGQEDLLSYKQTGVPDKTLRNLRKGKYNVDAILDLHGLTVEEAKSAIREFIDLCIRRDIDVALIIHGKGRHSERPVLKNKLNQWLRGINVVLAFCSAASAQGNRGAVYVLLKRKKEEFHR